MKKCDDCKKYQKWCHNAVQKRIQLLEEKEKLLKEIQIKDDLNQKIFFHAARYGHVDFCKIIINGLTDKNPKDQKGTTPLHWAAANGHGKICEMILDEIVDKNPKDQEEITPLHLAVKNGHTDISNLILGKTLGKNSEEETS